jgi:hypothetical protein
MCFGYNNHIFFKEDPNSVRLLAFEIGQSIVFLVQFSEFGIKYWTCGIPYKFTLQKMQKINKVWESYHKLSIGKSNFWSDPWHCREYILEYYKMKF